MHFLLFWLDDFRVMSAGSQPHQVQAPNRSLRQFHSANDLSAIYLRVFGNLHYIQVVDRLVNGVHGATVALEHADQHVPIPWESGTRGTALPRTSVRAACATAVGVHLCAVAVDYQAVSCVEADEEDSGTGVHMSARC